MKNSCFTCYLTLGTFLAGIFLMLGSWIGSLFDFPIQNMLSAEGIRWLLQNLLPNVESSPWLTLFILVMGLGVLRDSGLLSACFHFVFRWRYSAALSRKRRQALFLAITFFLIYVLVLSWATFSRHEILLGVTGTLERSPFLAGWPLLLVIGIAFPGGVYGLASGKFQGLIDLIRSFSSLFVSMSGFFIYAFCMAQCVGMFAYMRLDTWLGVSISMLSLWVYYLPFFLCLFFVSGSFNRSIY